MAATDDTISLREYVDVSIKRVADAVNSLEARMIEINSLHNQAHAREHGMVELAVSKAEQAMSDKLEGMNQFRQQISDERTNYITRSEFQRFEEGLQKQLSEMKDLLGTHAVWRSNLEGRIAGFGIVVTVLTIVSISIGLWANLS